MSSPRPTALRVAAAALVVAAAPVLSACAAGFDPATNEVEADNAAGQAGQVIARAIVLVKSENAAPAALAGTLINRGERPEVLERIELTESTPGARTITVEPNLTLRADQPVALGTAGTEPITVAQASGLQVGNFADVVLRFRTAGEIRLEVPIVPREGFYSDIVPSPAPAEANAPADEAVQDAATEAEALLETEAEDAEADRSDRRARKAKNKD